jgi:RHS repeat-associated protein
MLAVIPPALADPTPAAAAAGGDLGPYQFKSTDRDWNTGASSTPTSKPAVSSSAGALVIGARNEVMNLRTRASNTFKGSDGLLHTKFSTMPVNYLSGGVWKSIDDTLVAGTGGTLSVRADDYQVQLPASSTDPVSSGKDGLTVISQLQGAAAVDAVANGQSATYGGVFPGVDEIYTARPDSLEQSFKLASAAAPTRYTQTVTLTASYTLGDIAGNGSIPILDGTGAQVGTLPAPLLRDSSTNLDTNISSVDTHYELTGAAPTWTLTTVINPTWLSSSDRVFPVTLDPTVAYGTSNDLGCYVGNGSPDASLCSGNTGTDNQLAYGYTAYQRRIYLRFGDLTSYTSVIPPDAYVTDANLTLIESGQSNTAAMATNVHLAANTFGTSITWPGPQGTPTPIDNPTVTPPGVGQPVVFSVYKLAADWVNLRTSNNGFEIKLADENTPVNTLQFYGFANTANHPVLDVAWLPHVGQEKAVASYDHRLSDRMDIHVGYGSRNLVINNLDDQIAGPGVTATVRRTYNSRLAANGISGSYGYGWSMSGGTDVTLAMVREGVMVTLPGGSRAGFQRNVGQSNEMAANAYLTASNSLNAVLQHTDATHYTLTFNKTKERWTFTMPSSTATTAWLSQDTDNATDGNSINYTAAGSPLRTSGLTDSTGQRSITFTGASSKITGLTETLAAGATGARTMSYGYDSSGRLSTFTNADSKVTRYCYLGSTQLVSRIISPRGTAAGVTCSSATTGTDITDIAYDTNGEVASITYSNGTAADITVSFADTNSPNYDKIVSGTDCNAPGNFCAQKTGITTFTDAYGKQSTYKYDTWDRVTDVTDPKGGHQSATFNTNSDVTASITALNNAAGGTSQTTSTYDSNNNLTQVSIPTGATVAAAYTNSAQPYLPSSIGDSRDGTNATGPNSTSLLYGLDGQVIQGGQTGNTANPTSTYVDRHQGDLGVPNCGPSGTAAYKGAMCESRDANWTSSASTQHRTSYGYNSMGQLVGKTPAAPANGRTTPPLTSYGYDGFSRLTSITTGAGNTTTYTYDPMDRLTRATYQDGHYTAYTYDEDGELLTQTDKTAANVAITGRTFTYDGMNRSKSDQPTGAATNSYTWDGNSRLLTFTDASGTMTYGYDDAGSLTSMAQPGGSCPATYKEGDALPAASALCTIFIVDGNGNRSATIYPGNAVREEYTYDGSDRVTKIVGRGMSGGSQVVLLNLEYTYKVGSVDTKRVVTRKDAITNLTTTYDYSPQGWLNYATTRNASNAITSRSLYCYDANGNRTYSANSATATCPGTANATWDGLNQQLTGPAGTAANFTFDLDGKETGTGTGLAGGTTRTATWNNTDQNSSVTVGAGTALAQSFVGQGNQTMLATGLSSTQTHVLRQSATGISDVTLTTSGTTTAKTYVQREPSGRIAGFLTSTGAHYYPLTDNLGSILYVLDATGATAGAYTYDSWGLQTVSATPSFQQPFGYTGAYTNPTTKLVYLSARYYDPWLGRFTQPDPSGQETNPYSYAGNDPINHIDPSGLLSGWEWAAAIGVGVIVAVATGGAALPEEATIVGADLLAPSVLGPATAYGVASGEFVGQVESSYDDDPDDGVPPGDW